MHSLCRWCKFTQYLPNKTDKFGIKFWLAFDMQTKYILNGFPYLGKDETRVLSNQTTVASLFSVTKGAIRVYINALIALQSAFFCVVHRLRASNTWLGYYNSRAYRGGHGIQGVRSDNKLLINGISLFYSHYMSSSIQSSYSIGAPRFEAMSTSRPLSQFVILKFIETYTLKGRTITTDNF